jgi:ATP-dependent DNA ligase
MASRIGSQRDKGYINDLERAKSENPTNTLGMKMPMLAQKFKQIIPPNCAVQYKYDGNRCMITNQGGKIFAYSRQGKVIHSIAHILHAARKIPVGTILDGELYHHGTPLQTLRSWIARGQAESMNLVYMCYDVMRPDSYRDRYSELLLMGLEAPIVIAPTDYLDEGQPISTRFKMARSLGYEGLILRNLESPYEDGKRSSGLIKVKAWLDGEYTVIDIVASADEWAILVCEMDNGNQFRVSCHGTIQFKSTVLMQKSDYLGRRVTVEYANLTKDGIPFHPVAIAFIE